jgi:hypothetical protein
MIGKKSKCKVFTAEFFNTNEEVSLNTAYVCAGCMLLLIQALGTAILASVEEFKMCRWTNEEVSLNTAL